MPRISSQINKQSLKGKELLEPIPDGYLQKSDLQPVLFHSLIFIFRVSPPFIKQRPARSEVIVLLLVSIS